MAASHLHGRYRVRRGPEDDCTEEIARGVSAWFQVRASPPEACDCEAILKLASADGAWALAHEHGHVVDENAAIAAGKQLKRWEDMASQQHLPYLQRTREQSADAYACANTSGQLQVFANRCE